MEYQPDLTKCSKTCCLKTGLTNFGKIFRALSVVLSNLFLPLPTASRKIWTKPSTERKLSIGGSWASLLWSLSRESRNPEIRPYRGCLTKKCFVCLYNSNSFDSILTYDFPTGISRIARLEWGGRGTKSGSLTMSPGIAHLGCPFRLRRLSFHEGATDPQMHETSL